MALVRKVGCSGWFSARRLILRCNALIPNGLRRCSLRRHRKCSGQPGSKEVRSKSTSFAIALLFMMPTWVLAGKPICVGLDADLSGSAALGGQAIERGARIAISHINAAGGVLGRPLALKTMDHRGNPVRGVDNITALAKDPNCVAVLSGVHTPVVLQELSLLHDLQMPMLVPWAAGTPIIDNGFTPNYVFRLSVRDELAGQFFTEKLQAKGYQRIGLLLERTGWGRSNERSFGKASKTYGLTIVNTQWFHWGTKSLTQEVNALIAAGAEAIVLVANAPEGAVAVSEMASRSVETRVPIYSHWGITGGDFAEKVGLDTLKNVELWVLQTAALSGEVANRELRDRVVSDYKATFSAEADAEHIRAPVGVANAYDLVHILARAIEKAGVPDRVLVRHALASIDKHAGLIKDYAPPFTSDQHEALGLSDYRLGRFNAAGYINNQ